MNYLDELENDYTTPGSDLTKDEWKEALYQGEQTDADTMALVAQRDTARAELEQAQRSASGWWDVSQAAARQYELLNAANLALRAELENVKGVWKETIDENKALRDEVLVLANRKGYEDESRERIRELIKVLLDGLDDYWVTLPKGKAALEQAHAFLAEEK